MTARTGGSTVAGDGAGIYFGLLGGTITMGNSIVAGNTKNGSPSNIYFARSGGTISSQGIT